jgi:DNA-binding response OmpR family regulator
MTVAQQRHILSVLIVEDNSDTAESLARFLRIGCGYGVTTAADGLSGVRTALDIHPDVVVCDLGLPKQNGLLVAEELVERLPRRPLMIAVTGYENQVTREHAANSGFDHFLAKPTDPFEIEALIEAYVSRNADNDSGANG